MGDAFVHLIPDGFSIAEEGEDGNLELIPEEDLPSPHILSLMVIIGIVGFFLIEKIMKAFNMAHSHGGEESEDEHV